MGCVFCATGTLKLKTNLSAYEMLDTVWLAKIFLQKRKEDLTNVVYMGMGEPFANYPAVKKSIQLLHEILGIGWRRIRISPDESLCSISF